MSCGKGDVVKITEQYTETKQQLYQVSNNLEDVVREINFILDHQLSKLPICRDGDIDSVHYHLLMCEHKVKYSNKLVNKIINPRYRTDWSDFV